MTSTLNPAPTVRVLRRFRRPTTGVVRGSRLPRLRSPSHRLRAPRAAQGRSDPANSVQLGQIAWSALFPAVFLTALGWWGTVDDRSRMTGDCHVGI